MQQDKPATRLSPGDFILVGWTALALGWLSTAAAAPLEALVLAFTAAALLIVIRKTTQPTTLFVTATLVFACLLLVVIAELAFRFALLEPQVPRTEKQFERVIASRWPESIPRERTDGTYRIVILGDSFGLSSGAFNHAYTAGEILSGSGTKVEVVNLSVGGYSLKEELELLRRFGKAYRPDLVIHGFYVGNDFEMPSGEFHLFAGIPVYPSQGWRRFRIDRFSFFDWAAKYVEYGRNQRVREEERQSGEAEGFLSRDVFAARMRAGLEVCRKGRETSLQWKAALDLLHAIHDEIAGLGAGRLLLVHPHQVQLCDPILLETLHRFDLSSKDYDLDLPQRFLATHVKEWEVIGLDVLPLLRATRDPCSHYGFRDVHYSLEGDREVGVRLASEIDRRFLEETPK